MSTPPLSDLPMSTTSAPPSSSAELRALLRLAGPVVLSQFAANALALIATAVIGRLGARELAAAAYANHLDDCILRRLFHVFEVCHVDVL